MKKYFVTWAVILGISVILVVSWFQKYGWHRHYFNWYPTELAEHLVKNDRSASECFYLLWFQIMGPQEGEARAWCVYEYAKLKKDPSACELLMPSSYGLSCVGAATNNDRCFMGSENTVAGNGINVPIAACINGPKSIRSNACCTIALVASVLSFNDCSSLSSIQEFYDECQYRLAFKNHDPTACKSISDPNMETGCTVATKALRKDPSICSGCTAAVESVEQLPK